MTNVDNPRQRSHYASAAPEFDIRERYISKDWLRRENEKLWPHVWQMACPAYKVDKVGSYYEYVIADQSILVMRTSDTEIKAFHNSCLHRGSPLKVGAGNTVELRCPVHAWCWHLDGSLKEVIDPQDFDPACISPEQLHLPEVQLDTYAGFVFVNMDAGAAPLRDYLGEVPDRLGYYRYEDLTITRWRSAPVEANWKLALETFLELYHAVGTHAPSLMWVDDTNISYEQFGLHGVCIPGNGTIGTPSPRLGEFMPERRDTLVAMIGDLASEGIFKQEELEMIDSVIEMAMMLPEDQPLGDFFAMFRRNLAFSQGFNLDEYSNDDILVGGVMGTFPNLAMPYVAGAGQVIRFRPNGLDPDSSLVDVFYLELRNPEDRTPTVEEHWDDWRDGVWGNLMTQDLTNIAKWQKGVHNRGYRGPIWGRQDGNVMNFHRGLTSFLER